MNILRIVFFALLSPIIFAQNPVEITNEYMGDKEYYELLFVSIQKQKLYHIKNNKNHKHLYYFLISIRNREQGRK